MCLFPKAVQPNTPAYRRGIKEFECGVCPECLSRRSRYWALRACMEAKTSVGCMVTLTYDNFIRDSHGRIIGELPPDRSLHVNKRDVQLFIKRLRRAFPDKRIKYIATAEYGSHTHRAHYHVLLFGVMFPDLIRKGKSKRGNVIYRSPMLSRIWANAPKNADWRTLPICTVDSINIGPSVARYCTKYCSKDSGRAGGDDTFMLFSRGIGMESLLREFNGKSYILDGKEYAIPRQVWQYIISEKYGVDFRYVSRERDRMVNVWRARNSLTGQFIPQRVYLNEYNRARAREARDADPDYQKYISYWQDKISTLEITRPPRLARLLHLDSGRYRFYKAKCLDYLIGDHRFSDPPRTSAKVLAHHAYVRAYRSRYALPSCACHMTANDTETEPVFQVFLPGRYYDVELPPLRVRNKEVL